MTRRLYLSGVSPYARKVRIVLIEKGLRFEEHMVDLAARTADFVAVSPLGKIPVLVDEDGTVVFDSSVIVEYLEDRHPEPATLGEGWRERLLHRALDELGDTLADQAVAARQAAMRGDDAGHDRAMAAAHKALTELERRAAPGGAWPARFGVGDAAVLSAVGYFELRHGREPLAPYRALHERLAAHAARPSVARTAPQG